MRTANKCIETVPEEHFQSYMYILHKKRGWKLYNYKIKNLNKMNNFLAKLRKTDPRKIEYMRGDTPKNRINFLRVGPLQYRLPLLGECSRNSSVSLYQLMMLREAALSISNFFTYSFNVFAHFMMSDLQAHLSTLH